jgi:flagellar L-ring protein precursor FlgH
MNSTVKQTTQLSGKLNAILLISNQVVICLVLLSLAVGCSSIGKSLKGLVGGNDDPAQRRVTTPKFSEQENLRATQEPRQYKRMNRERFEQEAEISAGAGSLWVMEGQSAYLFSQNKTRTVGDLLNVKIEGGPRQQLQTKTRVITKLLERLDYGRSLASLPQTPSGNGVPPAGPAGAKPDANGSGAAGGDDKSQGEGGAVGKPDALTVQTVPTRIIEQLKDGSYRVRGTQPFMIGKREYKVIVTGLVRPEDFDDAGIDSSKLLDSQFDIVSSRKGAAL